MQLTRTPRVGPVTFFQLLAKFGSAANAIDALPSMTRGRGAKTVAARADIMREFEDTNRMGGRILCAAEVDYPPLLKQLSPPPPVISVKGRLDIFAQRPVAIVGARPASAAGRKMARDIASDLSEAGYAIVSGLARGIDGEAHAASLKGGTIAVLAGGLDHIYPPEHQRLYEAIAQQGLLVSESPFGYRASAKDFPRRNRIITGLSEGVVVIEAAERSGSLISARTALEQNREVMAVPASPLESRSAGSNRLLREGAILVRNAEDVIEALASPLMRSIQAPPPTDFEDFDAIQPQPEPQIEAVKFALGPHPMPIAEIARVANLGYARCATILVELELSGIAVTYAGGFASLALESHS